MYQKILLLVLFGRFLVPGLRQVSGVSIFTAHEVEAVNGTDVNLKCRFTSLAAVSQFLSISWSFQPKGERQQAIFHYNKRPYPATVGQFRKRVVWSGDVNNNDASITLRQVTPDFDGSYTCKVLNPPDVHGRVGEVILRVVNKTSSFEWFLTLYDMMGV
ncbi:myelin protein zero-like protein 2 [Embiotoca jacksoni]|uniref:myelin protein zero-like protein 2 n=1 Tax=Embiotoca jacksoni TaxID=100190 RepID=UPI0037044F78